MFCRKCGNELENGAKFCSKCGQIIEEVETVETVELDQFQQKQKDGLSGTILKYGILSLAFACSFFLSFLGIIFGAKAKKGYEYFIIKFKYENIDARARVGQILAKVGFILGIVLTAIFVFYIFVIIAALSEMA